MFTTFLFLYLIFCNSSKQHFSTSLYCLQQLYMTVCSTKRNVLHTQLYQIQCTTKHTFQKSVNINENKWSWQEKKVQSGNHNHGSKRKGAQNASVHRINISFCWIYNVHSYPHSTTSNETLYFFWQENENSVIFNVPSLTINTWI